MIKETGVDGEVGFVARSDPLEAIAAAAAGHEEGVTGRGADEQGNIEKLSLPPPSPTTPGDEGVAIERDCGARTGGNQVNLVARPGPMKLCRHCSGLEDNRHTATSPRSPRWSGSRWANRNMQCCRPPIIDLDLVVASARGDSQRIGGGAQDGHVDGVTSCGAGNRRRRRRRRAHTQHGDSACNGQRSQHDGDRNDVAAGRLPSEQPRPTCQKTHFRPLPKTPPCAPPSGTKDDATAATGPSPVPDSTGVLLVVQNCGDMWFVPPGSDALGGGA